MKRPWDGDRRHRHPNDAQSKLERWILEQGGTRIVAQKLGVHQVTVCTWLGRRATPNLEVATLLIGLSAGSLTNADILEGTKPW